MRLPRFTIAGLMASIGLVGILLALYRFYPTAVFTLAPFGITTLISRFGSSSSVRRLALGIGVTGTLLLPLLVSFWINHEIWGYYVKRPAVDRQIINSRQIETVTQVESQPDSRGRTTFSGAAIGDVGDYTQMSPQEGDYYLLEGRVLRALQSRRALEARLRVIPASRLEGLYQVLDNTGRLEWGEPGYTRAKELRGIVIEARSHDNRHLLFAGVQGGEVSNDHHPYYEFLFASDSSDGPWVLISFHRFYFDVAGIEGLEWPVFFPYLAFLGLVPTLPVQAFVLWRGRHGR